MRAFRPPPGPRVGLLGKFAIASLVPIVLLGLVLAHVLRADVKQRAVADASQSAIVLEQSLVLPRLTPADLRDGLGAAQVRTLDALLHASVVTKEIARVKIWNRQGRAVYATDHTIIGKRFSPSDELRRALAGRTASEVSDLTAAENRDDRSFKRALEVYTPLQFGGRRTPVVGAFELYLRYLPIQATIDHDTERLTLILLGGLALLYLALVPIAASASTRLRRQASVLRRQAEENEHLALHDTLTGLPNRSLFRDRAAQAILATRRDPGRVGLLLLDLDRFKEINDTLGHRNGDAVLEEVGRRLCASVRATDTVARLGGDEFGVLLPRVRDAAAALTVADTLRHALHEPLVLEGIALDLDASVGVVLSPDHGDEVETLLQRADVAMYVAKSERTRCELYSPSRDEYSPARLALAGELRRAIDGGELVLHFQPKADLPSGRVRGVEALVRWQHPDRGLLGPDQFVPLAERTGLIRELTRHVLAAALRQLREWEAAGIVLDVAVNLSARDLVDAELPDTVAGLLDEHGVEPRRLELEITESVLLTDPTRAGGVLARLDAMGVRLAIDDFGSGYSSLAYLKRLPVGAIKIDRSFVTNMGRDENDAVIVRSTIDLGRTLGLRVVAEGVEDERAWSELARLRCDQAQGYFLSRPLPAEALAAWLRGARAAPFAADGSRLRGALLPATD
ncbi:MAG TPA: EAL domain-containing protein [Gaiellaceae bacterium]|nr:EAL domain-containing protein [Gaiellaceae bacterium]